MVQSLCDERRRQREIVFGRCWRLMLQRLLDAVLGLSGWGRGESRRRLVWAWGHIDLIRHRVQPSVGASLSFCGRFGPPLQAAHNAQLRRD